MDYNTVYSFLFKNTQYSSEDHIQYHYVLEKLKNISGNSLIDVGSGRGHLLKYLKHSFPEIKLTSLDLNNYHGVDVSEFIECNLSDVEYLKNFNRTYDILTCTDVFEHLDKSFIEDVVKFCSKTAKFSILAIANHSDIWNGVELHTIQEDKPYWDSLLEKYFCILESDIKYDNRLYLYLCISKEFKH